VIVARGRFLAFEGIDGCGKSTLGKRLAQEFSLHFTFEPGDSALGADLRQWLLRADAPMTPVTESLLMLSDRSHHVASVIEPLLALGHHRHQ
jgi:dTMP kinase